MPGAGRAGMGGWSGLARKRTCYGHGGQLEDQAAGEGGGGGDSTLTYTHRYIQTNGEHIQINSAVTQTHTHTHKDVAYLTHT